MAPKAKAKAKSTATHVVPAEMLVKKAKLLDAREAAKRTLKAVRALDLKEAQARTKLNKEAASLPLDLVRKVIQAKVDLPDLRCPHCKVSMDCRTAMTAAFVAVENGRAVQPAGPPKPLAALAAPVSATGAGGGIAVAT